MKKVIVCVFVLILAIATHGLMGQTPIAEGGKKFLGNVYSTSQRPAYEQYWNQVTPENGGKWGSVEGTRDVMNWTDMDAAYALAKDNGYPIKQHVLVWGSQQPAWIGDLTEEEQLAEIEEWFSSVAERYPDLDIVEVVNEPLHAPPVYKNALGGNGLTGWDWVIKSFEMAREYFPNAKLIMNDYGILGNDGAITTYLRIAKLLTDRDLIDHLGVQGHAFTVNNMLGTTITDDLDDLAASGLPLYVTEFDIDGDTDELQLSRYQEVFPAIWRHTAVEGVTLWGWRPGMWRSDEKAYLINTSGQERPALVWLREYVSSEIDNLTALVPQDYSIAIYPNPITEGMFSVKTDVDKLSMRIADLSGKAVVRIDEVSQYNELPSLEGGLYIFRVYKDGKLIQSEKIMVK